MRVNLYFQSSTAHYTSVSIGTTLQGTVIPALPVALARVVDSSDMVDKELYEEERIS